jgi:hypothetical protein
MNPWPKHPVIYYNTWVWLGPCCILAVYRCLWMRSAASRAAAVKRLCLTFRDFASPH